MMAEMMGDEDGAGNILTLPNAGESGRSCQKPKIHLFEELKKKKNCHIDLMHR